MKGNLVVIALALTLAACSSSADPDIEPAQAQEPAAAPVPSAEPLPAGPLTAGQIAKALSDRTFQYTAPDRSGTVTYYNDGTFSYQEMGKGAGTGNWQASDGQLCEAYNPTSFLPRGTPSTCSPISSDGSMFTVGQMQLQPA